MHRTVIALATILLTTVVAPAAAQPPPDFELHQNDPDPFCGETAIEFLVPELAHIVLVVRDPADQMTIRLLVDSDLPAGTHVVLWDGKDAVDEQLPNGMYPYRMTATDIGTETPLFTDAKVATKECLTPIDLATWGAIKAFYQR